jgi:hypothetical protein
MKVTIGAASDQIPGRSVEVSQTLFRIHSRANQVRSIAPLLTGAEKMTDSHPLKLAEKLRLVPGAGPEMTGVDGWTISELL